MREFASTNYRLSKAPRWQKVLYTSFLAFMVLGVGSNVILGFTRTGWTPRTIAEHYRGNPERLIFEKTFQELLEVTHIHAFVMPMVLLVLGHLFLLTNWPARIKRTVVAAAIATSLLELLLPWAIRYGHAGWAYLKCATAYGLAACLGCFVVAPLAEMWGRR